MNYEIRLESFWEKRCISGTGTPSNLKKFSKSRNIEPCDP